MLRNTVMGFRRNLDRRREISATRHRRASSFFSIRREEESAGWRRRRIFLMWFALVVATAIGAGLGFLLAGVITETWLVFAEGVAAGAMLTMIAAAMIPEAPAHGSPSGVGLSTLAGFLAAVLFKLFE